jgi:hypothetical protein
LADSRDTLSSTLCGKHIDSNNPELPRDILFRRSAEWVESVAYCDIEKTNASQNLKKLSLRESTGDSASPKINVSPYRLGKLTAYDDVSVQKTATRFKNAEDLAIGNGLIGNQVEHPVRNDNVHTFIIERQ